MTSSPSAARGREVRQRLLAAATELIPELGWAAVSTRVLAERAGVTPGVVHYHFASLQAVLNEAAVGAMRQLLADADAVLDTASTPTKLVDAVLGAVDEYTGTDQLSLLAVEAYLAASRDDELRHQIADALAQFRQRLAERLTQHGVPAAEATAAVLAATIDGLLLHRALASDTDTKHIKKVLRRLVC